MTTEPKVPAPEETNPFEGFVSEGYEDGELVEPKEPPKEEPKEEPGEEPKEEPGEEPKEESKEEPGKEPETPPKPKQTAQERINELTRLRREAEREAEALKARLQEIEEQSRRVEPKEEPKKKPEAKKEEGPPDPADFEYGELDTRFITALVEYQTDQRIAAFKREAEEQWQQDQAQREQEETRAKFQEKVAAGSKIHEDYYEKVVVGAERGEWALSEHMAKLLVDSDAGHDIAYHLATHPEESVQIFRQSPVEQARYFGRMEAKFSAAQSAAPEKTEPAKTPKAPPPVLPARGSDGKFQPSADSEDFSAFERVAMTQEK